MKILILGGTGTFGSRLARMLIADGHTVTIAARNIARTKAFCTQYGGTPLTLSRDAPLSQAFNGQDIIVDAAGPYQNYGADPYRVPRTALEANAHYLDLSDDAAFTTGIATLDPLARSRNRTALSGVSSVPALSSAAVATLAEGLSEIALIHTAILPGNRAPRGRSVMASILSQTGAPLRLWRGNQWIEAKGWTDTVRIPLGPANRPASLIGAPDLTLFPKHFNARSVLFRAGLELGVMHHTLRLLARLRPLIPPERLLTPLHHIAQLLEPFGTDTGGMIVEVSGRTPEGTPETRRWTLEAAAGDGPFIPAIPARLLINRWSHTPPEPGARPCLTEFTLTEAETALSALATTCTTETTPAPRLFETALGPTWHQMPAEFHALHDLWDRLEAKGEASVTRGTSPLSRLTATIFGFPKAAERLPVTVTMTRTATGETWERNFAGHRFRSHLTPAGPARFRERFGPFTFEMDLPIENHRLSMPVRKGWFFGLPLPKPLLPISETTEHVENDRFHFDVRLSAPLAGLLVHYKGWLEPTDHSQSPPQAPGAQSTARSR